MTTKKDKHDGNGFWTPERIAAAKADPRQNDPNNWAANPQLGPEDEAILDKLDQERIIEAEAERAVTRAIKEGRKPKNTNPEDLAKAKAEAAKIPKDVIPAHVPKFGKDGKPADTRSGRFTSDGDDGGMTVAGKPV